MAQSTTSFKPGQSGNPRGRPSSKQLTELRELLNATFPQAARERVIHKLVEDAERGNHDARVLLLAYTYGKPIERREVTGAEGAPIEIRTFDFDTATASITTGSEEDREASG